MSRLVFFTNQWASGEIRGRQMAAAVGGVTDPDTVYPDDVVVFIKSHPSDNLIGHCRQCYVDVDDNYTLIPWLKEHHEVGVIAASRVGQQFLNEQTGRDDVMLIPGHHCNYERAVRVTDRVKTAGFIGYPENLHLGIDELHNALAGIGIDFVAKTDAKSRRDVCNFYQTIDIQICFRKASKMNPAPKLRDPLKLINAGSFGIPTVSYPEPTYVDEFGDCFLLAESLDDVVAHCNSLKNVGWFYHQLSTKAMQRAEPYHIQHISPLFRKLHTVNLPRYADELRLLFARRRAQKLPEHAALYTKLLTSVPRSNATLLEIGVADGRSLRVWSDFLAGWSIYGIDTAPPTEPVGRATVLIGNQADTVFLGRALEQIGKLDVVIDDGSHKPDDQIASLKMLLPHVQHGGYYVIEDLTCGGGCDKTVDFIKSLCVDFELLPTSNGDVDICVIKVGARHDTSI